MDRTVCVCQRMCDEFRAVFALCQGGKGRAAVSSGGEVTSKSINIRPNEFHLTRASRVCEPWPAQPKYTDLEMIKAKVQQWEK